MFHTPLLTPAREITPKTKVYSVGTYLPKNIVSSIDIFTDINSEKKYGIPVDWMTNKMGIIERRLAEDGAKPSDLAIPAAQEAIDNFTGFNKDEIDMVIFCGIERDQPEPATAHTIQDKLGLSAHKAFDMSNACFGFFDAMERAADAIALKKARYVLVVTGEVPSRVLRSFVRQLKKGVSMEKAQKLIGGLSVGDAGAAAILGANYETESGFEVFNTVVDSAHVDKCIYKVLENGEIEGQMLMGQVLGRGHNLLRKLSQDTLARAGWDEYDWFISHQPGKASEDFAKKMCVVNPTHIIKLYDKLGNITSASFPFGFKKLINNDMVTPGNRIGGWYAGSGITAGQFCYTF